MKPGEIALVNFPFSSHELQPYKKRPVLALGANGTGTDEVIFVAMITGSSRRVARPGTGDVPIANWERVGLAKASVIRARRLWTAETRDFVRDGSSRLRRLGQVDADVVDSVKQQVRYLLDL